MHLFYTPDIQSDIYTLSAEESRHATSVLRLKASDRIHFTDGAGTLYLGEIIDPSPKACVVKIIERSEEYGKRPYDLHIAIAPTKNIDRYEWFLEKATEIGIDRITPIECMRSERRIVKQERSEKVILSAVKQSLKAYYPQLDPLTSSSELFKSGFSTPHKYIAHCDDNDSPEGRKDLFDELSNYPSQSYIVVIGPEGDFSPEEVEIAIENGYLPVSLGSSRLRTETAGVMAAAMAAMSQQNNSYRDE